MSNLIRLIVKRGRDERLGLCAGGLTFTTLLSLVPLLAVSFALFTRVPALRTAGEAIRGALLRALLPPAIVNTVLKHVEHWAAKAGGLTLLGSLCLLLSAVGLLLSVENVFNRIWQVRKPRALRSRLALYASLLLAAPVALGASLWASSSLLNTSGARR
jgi:membrane protein